MKIDPEMNTVNKDGKAFNGNWYPIMVSVATIVFVALVVIFT